MSDMLQDASPHSSNTMSEQLIIQQQELILVLKEEIIRLQDEAHHSVQETINLRHELQQVKILNGQLSEKIRNISENNESLLRTVQVFQREFIKRDCTPGALGKLPIDRNGTGQFHLQIVRNLKSKLSNITVEPSDRFCDRSTLSCYYGYFLQDQKVQQTAVTLFNEIVQQKRPVRSSKVRSLGKKNFFHQNFRHVFWYSSIENKQKITQKLYLLLNQQLADSLENKPPKTSIIDLDLRRMDLKLDEEKSKKVSTQIKRCLQLFEIYRPDIKYVQGMSYLAWIFLIRMSPYHSFSCFCNLILSDPFVYGLYLFDQQKIKRIVSYFEECLEDKKPKLYKHLKNCGVDSELFLIEWAYTMYSRTFSLRIVSKIWDLWFSEGYNTFFKVAMTIFEMLQSELLDKQENDKLIDTVRTNSFKLEETEFLKILGKQKLFEELKLE